ncbi:MAG: RtcB family protein [Candidatus Diapherotrites archaeon]|nr:RtcB family protein [Candidatus Diapherotrites archaeon]
MKNLKEVEPGVWEIPREGNMRVPGRIFGTKELVEGVEEGAFNQVKNVAHLPGIVKYSLAMPDIHWGYGFPIGGVAATDPNDGGVISPGGVGYDINCGVRLMRTNFSFDEFRPTLRKLVEELFKQVPAGLGHKGEKTLSKRELDDIMQSGSNWCVENGFAWENDIERTEEKGCIALGGEPTVSDRARKRGSTAGSLGSGNHFLEVQKVDKVYDEEAAAAFGLREGAITVMTHCGSRGFGHQIASDALKVFENVLGKYNITLPDKQLACAPVNSDEGQQYLTNMNSAINYAFVNRQMITSKVRTAFENVYGKSSEDLGLDLIYDVCHNIAKFEKNKVDGKVKKLCVHRKGATRAYPAGKEDVPSVYSKVGHPVLIPGDMGTASYVCAGLPTASKSWFSACHGAGRQLSRTAASRKYNAEDIRKKLEAKGQVIMSVSRRGIVEEAPGAYKNIDSVVDGVELAGLAKKVVRLVPLGVVKG